LYLFQPQVHILFWESRAQLWAVPKQMSLIITSISSQKSTTLGILQLKSWFGSTPNCPQLFQPQV
jgi:hypothetical protein